MKQLGAADLAMMQTAQNETLFDTCVILYHTVGGRDSYGQPAVVWAQSESLDCGFDPGGAREVLGETQVAMRPATLRLPLGTTVGEHDRIKITHRHGATLSEPAFYGLIGTPERGPSGLVLKLESVPDPEVD